jgi:hypothetical protein
MGLNVWTSIVLFLLAAAYFIVSARRHPGRESVVRNDVQPDEDGEDQGARDDAEQSSAE